MSVRAATSGKRMLMEEREERAKPGGRDGALVDRVGRDGMERMV
jgi:hypothetical protein